MAAGRVRRSAGAGVLARAGWSGQGPGSVLVGQAHREQSAQVQGGNAVVEPVVVLVDPAVRHAASASGQPGDRAFHHRSVLAVDGLEVLAAGALAVLALQQVVLTEFYFAAGRLRWCIAGAGGNHDTPRRTWRCPSPRAVA